MKDFNFFSPYLLQRRNKRLKRIYIIAVSSLLTIGLLSFTALNLYQIVRYTQEITTVENYLNSSRTKELLKKFEEAKLKTELTVTYYDKVSSVDKAVRAKNTVSTDLLDKLSSVMPSDSFMLTMKIKDHDMEILYSVKGLVPVAEIEHNLKGLDIFTSVHVDVINNQMGYTAIITCSLKDVEN